MAGAGGVTVECSTNVIVVMLEQPCVWTVVVGTRDHVVQRTHCATLSLILLQLPKVLPLRENGRRYGDLSGLLLQLTVNL